MPKSSRSSFPVSTVEWIASLYMAALPVTSAAPNLQIAIATLPAIAAMMTRSEPECSATIQPPLRAGARRPLEGPDGGSSVQPVLGLVLRGFAQERAEGTRADGRADQSVSGGRKGAGVCVGLRVRFDA